jgi:hypothetical protein
MSSSFSDKPYPPPRSDMPPPAYHDEPPRFRHEPRTRLNLRRLLAGMSSLLILLGALLICFIHGGLLNQRSEPFSGRRWVELNEPGHIIGFISLGIGAVGFVFLFSLEKRE